MALKNHVMPGRKLNKTQVGTVAPVLDRIIQKNGCLKPQFLVDEGRSPASPLHEFFTWDDSVAAELHRQEEARQIIRSIRVIRTDIPLSEQPVIRKFMSVHASDEETRFDGTAYLGVDQIMESKDYQQQTLNFAMEELNGWKARYDGIQEFFGIYAEIESLNRSVKLRRKAKPHQPA